MNDIKDTFDSIFPVTKDLSSLRKKGVLLEDIANAVKNANNVDEVVEEKYGHSAIPVQETVITNDDMTIGIYSFSARMGTPTYVVGTMSETDWRQIRSELRKHKLVR